VVDVAAGYPLVHNQPAVHPLLLHIPLTARFNQFFQTRYHQGWVRLLGRPKIGCYAQMDFQGSGLKPRYRYGWTEDGFGFSGIPKTPA